MSGANGANKENSINKNSINENSINKNLNDNLINYRKKYRELLEIPAMNISFKIKTLESTLPKKPIFGFMEPSEPILQLAYANKDNENSYVTVYNFKSNIDDKKLNTFFRDLTFISNKNHVPDEIAYQSGDRTKVLPHTRPFFILLNQQKIEINNGSDIKINNEDEIKTIINNIKKYICYLLKQLTIKDNTSDINKFQMYNCALLIMFSCEHILKNIIKQQNDSIISKLISNGENLNEYQIYDKIHSMICGNHNSQSGGKGKTKKSKRKSSKSNKKHKKTLKK